MSLLTSGEYANLWSAFSAISQAILAGAALFWSWKTFRKSTHISDYSEIDKMYFDLLKMRLGNPHLRKKASRRDEPEHYEDYEIYAYMMWNFLESVHDRCERDEVPDPILCHTWYPVFELEFGRHSAWMFSEDNERMFKANFVEWVANGGFALQDADKRKAVATKVKELRDKREKVQSYLTSAR